MFSPSNNERVLVVDENGLFLIPTSSANARRLIKEQKAKVEKYKPFIIRLTKPISNLDIKGRIKKMQINNLHEYFSEPKPVHIQNTSEPIGVISMEFRGQDNEIIPFKVPANRNPINLTNAIDFDVIKKSSNFKRFLQTSPFGKPKLQILSEEEYTSFYEKKRREIGAASAAQAAQEAEENATKFNYAYQTREKVVSEKDAMTFEQMQKGAGDSEIPNVNPKVISTCQQLDPEGNNVVLTPKEALDIFGSLELKMLDLDYILGHTYDHVRKENGIIRKWTLQRQITSNVSNISDAQNDEILKVGKKKRGRKPKVAVSM